MATAPEFDVRAPPRSICGVRSMKPWPRPFAWVAVIAASLVLALAITNLIYNTRLVGSWLPLLIMMPWSLYLGIWSLRNQDRR